MGEVLEVRGRAAARYLDVPQDAVRRARAAKLIRDCGEGFDAAHVLELGARPYVEDDELQRFAAGSILFVQQSPVVWYGPDDDDLRWLPAYGWSSLLTMEEALLSACGWWPIDPSRRTALRGVVSAVSTFVVTIGVVDPHHPVAAESGGKIRLNIGAATDDDPTGRALRRVFAGRRMRSRPGSSFTLP